MPHTFCRGLYNSVVNDIRIKDKTFKSRDHWAYRHDSKRFEVQNEKKGLYWYGQAHCAWDAKFQALTQWYFKEYDIMDFRGRVFRSEINLKDKTYDEPVQVVTAVNPTDNTEYVLKRCESGVADYYILHKY